MNVVGIIPARMASSRFPGKPLADIVGVPMVGHVHFRSCMSDQLDGVYVATCDTEIYDYVESIGGSPVMTSDSHKRASDRTAEALHHIEGETMKTIDIVAMIQGDEPMLRPQMIDEALQPLMDDPSIHISNLMGPLKTTEEHENPNEVKVVTGPENFALYYSREPIPNSDYAGSETYAPRKQVCIIPFRRDFLIEFNEMESTPLEKTESVDMLRILENGYRVKLISTEYETYSVDTESDRQRVESLMKRDSLVASYRE